MTLVICTGTGTEVGKTWIGAATLRALRADGRTVAARKPVQSYDPLDPADPATDAQVLAAATGEDPALVCPPHRIYEIPMAPPMAAAALGRPPFTLDDLAGEVTWPDPAPDVCWLETAGGVRSPLAGDGGDTADLCRLLRPDVVVLVADGGLGAINAVRLCCDALTAWPIIVLLNRGDPAMAGRNRAWLADIDRFDTETDPLALARRLGRRGGH